MLGWMALCMPITYTVLKTGAQMRHEFPITPVGMFLKYGCGVPFHADDAMVRAVYPAPSLLEWDD